MIGMMVREIRFRVFDKTILPEPIHRLSFLNNSSAVLRQLSSYMGEFLAAVAAEPVYRLLGGQGLDIEKMPAAGQPIMHTLGYYMHAGGHGTIPSDWDQFMKFLQLHLRSGTQ